MRGLVFSSLLACAHGLGDFFPYGNTEQHVWNDQTANFWAADKCAAGNRQSPIDIVSTAAATPTEDPGALVAKGFAGDRPLTWQVNGEATFPAAVTAQITDTWSGAPLGGTPLLFGGPLETEYVLIIDICIYHHFPFPAMPSPILSSTLERKLAQTWVLSTRSTE